MSQILGLYFHTWINALVACIEAAAAIIIGFAAAEAVIATTCLFVFRSRQQPEAIRLQLGRWLSLAIEFELAADILRTTITPTWSDLGKLAAIVVIRTAINYSLQQEIDKALLSGQLSGSSAKQSTVR